MRIFPNPATGNSLRCVFEDQNNIMTDYEVMNAQGQIVERGSAQTPEGVLHATLTPSCSGVCLVRAWRNNKVYTQRVVMH